MIEEFPYEEIRNGDGDYFNNIDEITDEGFKVSQVWSVSLVDDNDEKGDFTAYCYDEPHHVVNVIGYIATDEHRKNNEYYEEKVYYKEFGQ